jgi:DNA-binding FadR family transcriptional regulator
MATTGSRRAARVISWLRHQVTSGAWPVGTKIPTEPELTEQLHVGRSTVREAVRSLASLGILETAPGRGTFVRSVSPVSTVLNDYLGEKAVGDVLSVRRTLEIEAARRAALELAPEHHQALREALAEERRQVEAGAHEVLDPPGPFHIALVRASGNPLLTELYAGLAQAVRQAIRDGRVRSASPAEKLQDHERILAAIEKHDLVEAVHAANDHGDRDLVVVPDATAAPVVHQGDLQPDTKVVYRRVESSHGDQPAQVRVFRVSHDD